MISSRSLSTAGKRVGSSLFSDRVAGTKDDLVGCEDDMIDAIRSEDDVIRPVRRLEDDAMAGAGAVEVDATGPEDGVAEETAVFFCGRGFSSG